MIVRTRQGKSPHSRASTITSEGQIEVVVGATAAGSEAVVVVVDVEVTASCAGRTELKVNRSCVPVVLVSAIWLGVDDCGWSS